MTKRILNIGVLSVGAHARKSMIPAIVESDGVNFIGCYTRNEKVQNEISEQYNVPLCKSLEQLLLTDDLDAVYISSPTSMHFEQVKLCLNYGKHVLVEKTSFASNKQALEVISLARKKNLLVMEAFMFRYHSQFKKLQEICSERLFGAVKKIECKFGFPHLDRSDIRYQSDLAGGALNDAGAYTVCAARNLLIDKGELLWSYTDNLGQFSVDVSGVAIISDGNAKTICSWDFGASYTNEIKVWCEDAIVIVDRAFSKPTTFAPKIVAYNNGNIIKTFELGAQNHFLSMLRVFTTAIETGVFEPLHSELLEQCLLLEKIRANG